MAKKIAEPVAAPTDAGFIGCTVKALPPELHVEAAETAIDVNPHNAPHLAGVSALAVLMEADPPKPEHIALLTAKYWGTGGVKLGVAFLDVQDPTLKAKFLFYANSWNRDGNANIVFVEASASMAQVRVTTTPGDGYYSYLGTDILHIPRGQTTLNLDSFSLSTSESEWRRVVPHEFGHTCGFSHEAPRQAILDLLDVAKTLAYFEATQGWSKQRVLDQILTPSPESQLTANVADVHSCMCYSFPGSVTKSGQPIPGGVYIDASDADMASKLYPKAVVPVLPVQPPVQPPAAIGLITVDTVNKLVKLPVGWTAVQGG